MDNAQLLALFQQDLPAFFIQFLSPKLVSHNGKEFVLFIDPHGRKITVWFEEKEGEGNFGGVFHLTLGGHPRTLDERFPDEDWDSFWEGFSKPKPPKTWTYKRFRPMGKRVKQLLHPTP